MLPHKIANHIMTVLINLPQEITDQGDIVVGWNLRNDTLQIIFEKKDDFVESYVKIPIPDPTRDRGDHSGWRPTQPG
jgi:hypothetical protein